jgi:hypothetical protein
MNLDRESPFESNSPDYVQPNFPVFIVTLFFPNLPQFFSEKHHFFRSSVADSKPGRPAHISQSPYHSIYIWLYCDSTSQRCNTVPVRRYTQYQDQSRYKMKFGPNRHISVTRFIKDALITVLQCWSPLAHTHRHTHAHTHTHTKQLVEAVVGRETLRDSVALCGRRDWWQVCWTVQFLARSKHATCVREIIIGYSQTHKNASG